MIVDLKQFHTPTDTIWAAIKNEDSLCVALLPIAGGKIDVNFDFKDGENLNLYFNPYDDRFGSTLRDRATYRVFKNNDLIGSIISLTEKCKGFLQSYEYTIMDYKGEEYYLYEVGLWKDGLFICLYHNGQLLAIAEKELTTVNFKNKYRLYIKDEACFKPFLLMLVRYDLTKYGNSLERAVHSSKTKLVKTIQKELIAKYDPEFIKEIKQQEGLID